MTRVYEDAFIYIEVENSQNPWLKIFTQAPYKELFECDRVTKARLYEVMDIIQEQMALFYAPDKINIASFGNYLPHVHLHITARFKEDEFFPESMWGVKQREASLQLPSMELFLEKLLKVL
jgi:diadenosine tetraphosphate (Ap4A) HIT family hydrolase